MGYFPFQRPDAVEAQHVGKKSHKKSDVLSHNFDKDLVIVGAFLVVILFLCVNAMRYRGFTHLAKK